MKYYRDALALFKTLHSPRETFTLLRALGVGGVIARCVFQHDTDLIQLTEEHKVSLLFRFSNRLPPNSKGALNLVLFSALTGSDLTSFQATASCEAVPPWNSRRTITMWADRRHLPFHRWDNAIGLAASAAKSTKFPRKRENVMK